MWWKKKRSQKWYKKCFKTYKLEVFKQISIPGFSPPSAGLDLLSIFLRFLQMQAISQHQIKPCVGKICKDQTNHHRPPASHQMQRPMTQCMKVPRCHRKNRRETEVFHSLTETGQGHKETRSRCKQSPAARGWVSNDYE